MPRLLLRTATGTISLPLSQHKRPLRAEDFLSNSASIDAEVNADWVLEGIEFPSNVVPIFTVWIGEHYWRVYATGQRSSWRLHFDSSQSPFRYVIGLAWIVIDIEAYLVNKQQWFADPLAIRLSPGRATENLLAMSSFVQQHGNELFGTDDFLAFESAVRGGKADALTQRVTFFQDACHLYEQQFPYFKDSAAYQLKPQHCLLSIEKVQTVTSSSTMWIASHPDEWQRSPSNQGFKVQNRHWLPRHALTKISQRSHAIKENEAVLGFASYLAGKADTLADDIEKTRNDSTGGFSLAILGSIYLKGAVIKLRLAAKRLRQLSLLYNRCLHMEPPQFIRIPTASSTFLEIAAYRQIYLLMVRWYRLEFPDISAVEKRLGSMTSPRLYEYFTLLRLLHDFIDLGFVLEKATRFEYTSAGDSFTSNAAAANRNTFILKKNDERVRLWYQPALYGAHHLPENDLGLMRTSGWSLKMSDDGVPHLKHYETVYYSPDFVLAYDRGEKTVWGIIDSKYSKVSKVITEQGLNQAFKYLISLGTTNPSDLYAGLWLFCGSAGYDDKDDESLFDQSDRVDNAHWPTLQLTKLNGLNATSKNFAVYPLECMKRCLNQFSN